MRRLLGDKPLVLPSEGVRNVLLVASLHVVENTLMPDSVNLLVDFFRLRGETAIDEHERARGGPWLSYLGKVLCLRSNDAPRKSLSVSLFDFDPVLC